MPGRGFPPAGHQESNGLPAGNFHFLKPDVRGNGTAGQGDEVQVLSVIRLLQAVDQRAVHDRNLAGRGYPHAGSGRGRTGTG